MLTREFCKGARCENKGRWSQSCLFFLIIEKKKIKHSVSNIKKFYVNISFALGQSLLNEPSISLNPLTSLTSPLYRFIPSETHGSDYIMLILLLQD